MGNLRAVVVSSLLVGLIFNVQSSAGQLKDTFIWKQVDFKYSNATLRQDQFKSGVFVPDNVMPFGVRIWKNKLFLAIPRVKTGIPATLAYINLDDKSQGESPSLIPYPDWQSQQIEKTGPKIISVCRIDIDVCDRLWMIDTGEEDHTGKKKQIRPPRILAFDLKTDKLIHEYEFKNGETPASIVVDVTKDKCDQVFVYAYYSKGIFVYDFKNKDSWTHKRDTTPGDYNVHSISLAVPSAGEKKLWLRPPTSVQDFTVSTKALQSKTDAKVGAAPIGTTAFDPKTGVLFYATLPKLSELYCWNSVKHASSLTTTDLVPVSAMKPKPVVTIVGDVMVDENGNLWVVRSNDGFGQNGTGNRLIISTAPVAEAVKGTACAP